MRFNFSVIFRSPSAETDVFRFSNSKFPPQSLYGLSDLPSNPIVSDTFFAKFSSPLSSDQLSGQATTFVRRNFYLFDYIDRKDALINGRLRNSALTSLYPFRNKLLFSTQFLSNIVLAKSGIYFKFMLIFFRSSGFRRSGSFRVPVKYRGAASRDFYLFYFFRFFSFSQKFGFTSSSVFDNLQNKFKSNLSFFSFIINFFHVFRKPRFQVLRNRQVFFFRSRFGKFNPLYYYLFYSYLSRTHPLAAMKNQFFNFHKFYLGELIYFNRTFYIRKFVSQKSTIYLSTTY